MQFGTLIPTNGTDERLSDVASRQSGRNTASNDSINEGQSDVGNGDEVWDAASNSDGGEQGL